MNKIRHYVMWELWQQLLHQAQCRVLWYSDSLLTQDHFEGPSPKASNHRMSDPYASREISNRQAHKISNETTCTSFTRITMHRTISVEFKEIRSFNWCGYCHWTAFSHWFIRRRRVLWRGIGSFSRFHLW